MTRGRTLGDYIASDKQNNFRLLRLIAAAMVVSNHCLLLLDDNSQDDYFRQSFHISFLGLPSFFFLSGLLVTQSFYNSASWKSFLWKRALRIYPAACFSILTTALLMGPIITALSIHDYFLSPMLYKFLSSCSLLHISFLLPGVFTHSVLGTPSVNSSLWTLSLELKLYLGLLLFGLVNIPGKKWLLALSIITAIAFYSWKKHDIPRAVFPYFTFGVQFLIGSLCYHFKDRIIIRPYAILLLPPLFLLSFRFNIYVYTVYLLIPAVTILAGAFAVAQVKKITPRPDLSYGVYVFAFPVQQLVANYLHPATPLQLFILTMFAVIPVAILSWYGVEKKALRLKKLVQ